MILFPTFLSLNLKHLGFSKIANFSDCCVRDAPLCYFYREVLNISPSVGDTGTGMEWDLLGYLFLAWVMTYLCVVKGIRSSGKVIVIYQYYHRFCLHFE